MRWRMKGTLPCSSTWFLKLGMVCASQFFLKLGSWFSCSTSSPRPRTSAEKCELQMLRARTAAGHCVTLIYQPQVVRELLFQFQIPPIKMRWCILSPGNLLDLVRCLAPGISKQFGSIDGETGELFTVEPVPWLCQSGEVAAGQVFFWWFGGKTWAMFQNKTLQQMHAIYHS